MSARSIEHVLRDHTSRLMSLPGVVGVAQGERARRPCVLVLVSRKSPEVLGQIPGEIEGHPVHVDKVGDIGALDSS